METRHVGPSVFDINDDSWPFSQEMGNVSAGLLFSEFFAAE
jgi:hypothetical protein